MNPSLLSGLREPEARRALAEAITALFDYWHLSLAERQLLLGLSDPGALDRYREGEPLADHPQLLERAGHLLAIDRALREAYPDSSGFRRNWIRTPDSSFGGQSPLEVVRRRGLVGLRRIRDHLKFGGR